MRLRSWLAGSDGVTVSPQANGSWTASSSVAGRRAMTRKTVKAGATSTEAFTAGQTKECRCFVLDRPLRAGNFGGRVWCYVAGNESNADDNVSSRMEIYVVSPDLGTVRGTLLAIGSYGSGAELATSLTGIAFADGDTMSTIAVQAGDRVVVKLGGADAAGTTPSISLYIGGTESDVAEDESTTGSHAGWIDFEQGEQFVDVPTFVGIFTTPAAGGTNTADPTAVDPTTGETLLEGDLLVLVPSYRGTSPALPIQAAGGQAWLSAAASVSNTNIGARVWWARFNGSWSANPSVDYPGTSGNSLQLMVFRPSQSTMRWAVDQALVELDFTAGSSPFTKTVTGQTTTKPNTVTVAGWFTADDNTWDTLAGGGWYAPSAGPSGYGYPNLGGSDLSACYAYKVQAVAGATGNVSVNQATLGGDAGTTFIVTFYEYAPSVSPVSAPTINTSFSGTTGNVSLSSLSVTPGNLLLYAVGQYNDGGTTLGDPAGLPSGLVDTWQLVNSTYGTNFSTSTQAGGIWVYWGIATSGTTLTQTLHASHTQYRGTLTEVPGGVGIGVNGASQSASVTSRTVSMAGALSTSLNIAFGYVSGGNGASPSSGWTEDQDITSFMYHTVEHELPATGGSVVLVESFGSSRDMVLVACEVQGAPLHVPRTAQRARGGLPVAVAQAASF